MKIKVVVRLVGMLCFFVTSWSSAFAINPDIQLKGAVVTHSCGYYSSTEGNFAFSYRNDDLPWGTKVFLHYGYQVQSAANGGTGDFEILTWQQQKKLEMNAVSDSVWGAYLKESIHYRSKPMAAPFGINFVFEVLLPDGAVFWEKGTDTNNGHYTGIWDYSSVHCVDQLSPAVVLENMPISVH